MARIQSLRIPPLSADPRERSGARRPSELQRGVSSTPSSGLGRRNADRVAFSSGIAGFV